MERNKMFEVFKNKIWDLLKEKEVSFAMSCDRESKIPWHKEREVKRKDVRLP